MDPFAGGGSIPLEALRVGADAFASDLNPVPVLLNKVVLEYVPKYGDRLIEAFEKSAAWISDEAARDLVDYYGSGQDGQPAIFLWFKTIISEAPGAGKIPIELPLLRSMWLAKGPSRNLALRWVRDTAGNVLTRTKETVYANGTKLRVKEPLLHEVLVRDLRNGDWSAYVGAATGRWHPKGKELFRKLAVQSRFRAFRAAGAAAPGDDDTWCDEAIAASGVEPVAVILSTNEVARRHAASPLVHSIETATNTAWWRGRSPSKRVFRNTPAYIQALRLVLANSNSLMFIDPHVDPTLRRYQNFIQLLLAARRAPVTRLEIHRCCYEGPPGNRTIFTGANQAVLEQRFRNAWGATLQAAGVSASVYIWPDIHDRYLISNLMGMSVTNGFDESGDPNDWMMFTRLSRDDADGVQRDHDIAFKRHHYIIQIP